MSDSPRDESRERPVVVLAALGANLAIAVTKFVVAVFTGSAAMLSEAIHSAADTGNEVLLLVGDRRAARPADAIHPYGYGKEIFFWGLIVAVTLFGLGGLMSLYEGVTHLLHPRPIEHWRWALGVFAIAFVCESASLLVALRGFNARRDRAASFWQALRAHRDPRIYTVVGEDGAAIAGLLVGAGGVALAHATGNPAWDGVASVVIGVLLASVAVVLVMKSRRLLVGSGADRRLVRRVRELARRDRDVARAGWPLTMYLGPDELLLNLDVQFRPGLSTEEITAAVDRIACEVRREFPEVRRIFIETESLREEFAGATLPAPG